MATQTTNYNLVKPDYTDPADIAVINGNMDLIDSELHARAKTVNGQETDATGNVVLNNVPYANDLRTDSAQRVTGIFLERTTGGSASVSTGEARLAVVRGNRIHEGFVQEEITVDVEAGGTPPITVDFDRDTFVANVNASGTYVLTFDTVWDSDPDDYGITVDGTPEDGDKITIVYVKEERGTITQSDPQRFVATGYNLYNHTVGYAIGKRYSDEYGYIIDGTYTSVQFSATLNGSRTTITPVNKQFNIPGDGYIWVNGGNNTDTEVYATWGDWTGGRPGEFEEYSESEIDLSDIMSEQFPVGLMQVGDYRDEINFSTGETISYIERMGYNAENLATAKASGRAFEYDEDYIYLVRSSAVHDSISMLNVYMADDHGLELFTGSEIAAYAETVYGASLKNKLERDVLTIRAQNLRASQKAQVLANMGAVNACDTVIMRDDSFSVTSSLASGARRGYTATSLGVSPPSGYRAIGMITYFCSNADVLFESYRIGNTGANEYLRIKNTGLSAANNFTINWRVAYIRSSLIGS